MANQGGFRQRIVLIAWTVVVALAFADPARAQRPVLEARDFGQWERLGAFELGPSGTWLVTSLSRVAGESELRLYRADGTGEPLVLEHARAPEFSADGRWLAYLKGVPEEEREASETPISDRLGLVDLSSGADTVLFDVSSFAFRDDGRLLAARGVPPSDSVGADLMVLEPATGARTIIGHVSGFEWQGEGTLLAATLQTSWGSANGTVLYDPEASTLRTLDSSDAEYTALTWREDSSQLAVLRSVDSEGREDSSHDILVWEDPRGSDPVVMAALGGAVPAEVRVTPFSGIGFSQDGRTIFVGVLPWEPSAVQDSQEDEGEADEEAEDAEVGEADVQVWHWDDDLILRAQEYRADQLSRRSFLAAWHLGSSRFVILGDELDEPVTVIAGGTWGLVPDYDPYRFERRFGAGSADWYRVDVATGERSPLAAGLEFGVQSNETRSRVLAYDQDRWEAIDVPTLERTVLGAGRSFTRSVRDYDYPGPRPSWGMGGWLGADEALVYDKHDVFVADLVDGSLERLTQGAETGIRYRVVDIDPDASFGPADLDPGEDVWLSVFNLRSKASGYARSVEGRAAETLVLEDARVSGLTRSRDAERLALRMERWDDSPDVFVGGGDLGDLRQLTETNAFQSEFAWGRTELLDYTTDAGHDLQAILAYPADFREGRRYPLILYQYELLSDGLHSYHVPSERDYYDFQAWTQAGYFVLMPDIVYEPGRPGPSALDAVEHALDAAVATGHVDSDHMGLIGHSWGGYQATYLPTRTDRFAASVAGAAITNFLSFMGAVHWNGGLPETGHWETGQARMAVPYWENLESHLESSPANFITDLDTPMLLMHGDEDGVVDFYQGLEFYNYARRAGKEVVLLVYPGADHGLTEEAQQVDYHRRILEWFGHYLKGEPAAPWITEGETWVAREKRLNGG
ncbi:MAG: prolyl oligopeptidase family serine peptidase [Gemmatimonadota bacterium]|nr:prolyl oligopeptidase family serine peptidase [Gemmatimonadota bacterium]